MNKKILYGFIAVFVISEVVSILMNGFAVTCGVLLRHLCPHRRPRA